VIPDGLWAGTLSYVPDDDLWEVNLVCIYSGAEAQQVISGGTANVIDDDDPDYVIVDNNPRTRLVPNRAELIETSFADSRTDGRCLLGISGTGTGARPDADHVTFEPGQFEMLYSTTHQAWLRIHDGESRGSASAATAICGPVRAAETMRSGKRGGSAQRKRCQIGFGVPDRRVNVGADHGRSRAVVDLSRLKRVRANAANIGSWARRWAGRGIGRDGRAPAPAAPSPHRLGDQ
jgi:hypothetical protein